MASDSQPHDSSEEFVTTFARNESHLRAFVRSMGLAWEDVDEVMQTVSLVLWRKWTEFDRETDFMKWARVVARFEVLKYRRKLARDRHVFDPELIELLAEEAEEEAEKHRSEEYHRALEFCLSQLPEKTRTILMAAYEPGQTIREVAASIGKSATALYKSLDRSRQKLLLCIEGQLQPAEDS